MLSLTPLLQAFLDSKDSLEKKTRLKIEHGTQQRYLQLI